ICPEWSASSSARTAALSIRGPPELEQDVGAPRLEARQVHRDVDVTELTESPHDRLVAPVLPEPRDLVERNLEPRQPVVVAEAELADTEGWTQLVGGNCPSQLPRGDRVAVLEA